MRSSARAATRRRTVRRASALAGRACRRASPSSMRRAPRPQPISSADTRGHRHRPCSDRPPPVRPTDKPTKRRAAAAAATTAPVAASAAVFVVRASSARRAASLAQLLLLPLLPRRSPPLRRLRRSRRLRRAGTPASFARPRCKSSRQANDAESATSGCTTRRRVRHTHTHAHTRRQPAVPPRRAPLRVHLPLYLTFFRSAFVSLVAGGGKVWHSACFRCQVCRTGLSSTTLNDKDGGIYCGACYGKQFGPKGFGFAGGSASTFGSTR